MELSLRELFEAPTVATLAAQLGLARPAAIPLQPWQRPEGIPLSFAQRRLWFLNRMQGPSATYNIVIALRLIGHSHTAALAEALPMCWTVTRACARSSRRPQRRPTNRSWIL